jgi:hypothetical protein
VARCEEKLGINDGEVEIVIANSATKMPRPIMVTAFLFFRKYRAYVYPLYFIVFLYLLKKEGKRPEGLSGSTSFSRKPSGRCVLIPKILRIYDFFDNPRQLAKFAAKVF